MGKYKQWLHHQEVGARLRDEIAAYEAERERVLKLAPNRATPFPDLSNPIIAALLGHDLLSQAPVEQIAKVPSNGASAPTSAAALAKTETVVAEARLVTEQGPAGQQTVQAGQQEEIVTSKSTPTPQAVKGASQPAQEEVKTTRTATGKHKAVTTPPARQQEKHAEPAPAPSAAAQPDTIDPLLDALLARAENEPDDPLEALTAMANRGQDLTRGEPPTPLPSSAPTPSNTVSPGETALNALLNQSKGATNPQTPATAGTMNPAAEPAAASGSGQGNTAQPAQSSTPARQEKRVDTDELIAARPAEGYTEPRLAVPWWLRSVELNQEGQESEKPPATTEEAEARQRLSVSLPFENEEDMQLHESVERWWQRWRQQN
jgi:hypothetical protein